MPHKANLQNLILGILDRILKVGHRGRGLQFFYSARPIERPVPRPFWDSRNLKNTIPEILEQILEVAIGVGNPMATSKFSDSVPVNSKFANFRILFEFCKFSNSVVIERHAKYHQLQS